MSSASDHASGLDPMDNSSEQPQQTAHKKKRNLPGTPDPNAEVIALSPRTLMATNRFVCEVCGKGFQRDQNLQLHRRGHNLPWRLKQREEQEIKKRVYVCPEVSCVHHDPSRALGDLTGIKKHFFRKHGDKKWKCEKCSKRYAVQSDWKAHQKVCGTREYRCDCGTLFSRRDSFITHRAFCDALAEETAKVSAVHQVENQQGSEADRNAVTRASTSGTEASSSSFSHFTSGTLDTSVTSTPSTREGSRLRPGLEDGGIDSLASKHESELKADFRPSKGPALSLQLGTGPGPGPPGLSMQTMGCFFHGDSVLSTMSKSSIVGMGLDEAMHWPASSSGPGMFASMLESSDPESEPWREYSSFNSASDPWLGQSSLRDRPTLTSAAGLSMSTMDHSFKNSTLSQFAPPSSGILPSLSFFANGFLPSQPSSYVHPSRHTGSAQLPATALLQKAALMGATSSTSSSLFHSFGGDSSLKTTKEAQREPFVGVSSSLSSSNWPLSSKEKLSMRADNGYGYGERVEGSLYPALYNGQGTVQEFLNSLCNGGASVFQANTADKQSIMSNGGGSMEGDNRSNDQLMGLSNQIFQGSSDGSTQLSGLGGSTQGGEKSDGGRTTLDFLGVGGMARTAMGMARTLSQREIASITTLSAGIKGDPAVTRNSNVAG